MYESRKNERHAGQAWPQTSPLSTCTLISKVPPPPPSISQENKPISAAGGTWRWLSLREDANQTPNYLATNPGATSDHFLLPLIAALYSGVLRCKTLWRRENKVAPPPLWWMLREGPGPPMSPLRAHTTGSAG